MNYTENQQQQQQQKSIDTHYKNITTILDTFLYQTAYNLEWLSCVKWRMRILLLLFFFLVYFLINIYIPIVNEHDDDDFDGFFYFFVFAFHCSFISFGKIKLLLVINWWVIIMIIYIRALLVTFGLFQNFCFKPILCR